MNSATSGQKLLDILTRKKKLFIYCLIDLPMIWFILISDVLSKSEAGNNCHMKKSCCASTCQLEICVFDFTTNKANVNKLLPHHGTRRALLKQIESKVFSPPYLTKPLVVVRCYLDDVNLLLLSLPYKLHRCMNCSHLMPADREAQVSFCTTCQTWCQAFLKYINRKWPN